MKSLNNFSHDIDNQGKFKNIAFISSSAEASDYIPEGFGVIPMVFAFWDANEIFGRIEFWHRGHHGGKKAGEETGR